MDRVMQRIIRSAGCSVLLVFLLCRCENPVHERLVPITHKYQHYENTYNCSRSVGLRPFIGTGFGRADSTNGYTEALLYTIPDSLLNTDLRICFEGWVRNCAPEYNDHSLVVTVQKADECPLYYPMDMNAFTNDTVWEYFVDSTQLSAPQNHVQGAEVRIYGFNPKGRGTLDLDEFRVTVKKVIFY